MILVTSQSGERSLFESVAPWSKSLEEREGRREGERQEVSGQNLSPVSADIQAWVLLLLVFLIRQARGCPPGEPVQQTHRELQ